ncbi:hypothetical protein D782_2374 [Enterobacteriaceae bacterium strain FGI 57]|nr:hypothetical protein D782_2374 [Enterobacteriaceae bacterium strain FGI 57]
MGRGKNEIASVLSENTINLPSPYEGEQKATLSLRRLNDGDNEIVIHIDKGQIICDIALCSVLFKIDDAKPFGMRFNHPKDGSSNVIIGDLHAKDIKTLKKAKKIKVELTIHQGGEHVFTFNAIDNPFVGEKMYQMDEISSMLNKHEEIQLINEKSGPNLDSSFEVCKKVISSKDSEAINQLDKSNKNYWVRMAYYEWGVVKQGCKKGDGFMTFTFYEYK